MKPWNVRIGINPISWSNDDLPALGGETSLETALSAMLKDHDRVLIAGSLYLVGASRAKLIEAGFSAE